MAKKKAKSKSTKTVSFEESLDQLKLTVSQLENGNLSLSESLEQYEQGVANLKLCYQALNDAQQRIEMLVDLDEEGNLITQPFSNTASENMAQGTRRATHNPVDENPLMEDDAENEESKGDANDDLDDPNSLF